MDGWMNGRMAGWVMDGWIEVTRDERQSQSIGGRDNLIALPLISSIIVVKQKHLNF